MRRTDGSFFAARREITALPVAISRCVVTRVFFLRFARTRIKDNSRIRRGRGGREGVRLWRSCGLWACHHDFWHNALFYYDRYTAVMPRCHPLTADPSTRRLYINPRVPAAQTRMPIRAQRRDNTRRDTRALICRCARVCVYVCVHVRVRVCTQPSENSYYSYVDASCVILLEKPPSTPLPSERYRRFHGYGRYIASAVN